MHAKGMGEGTQLSLKSVSQWVYFKDNSVLGHEDTTIPAELTMGVRNSEDIGMACNLQTLLLDMKQLICIVSRAA